MKAKIIAVKQENKALYEKIFSFFKNWLLGFWIDSSVIGLSSAELVNFLKDNRHITYETKLYILQHVDTKDVLETYKNLRVQSRHINSLALSRVAESDLAELTSLVEDMDIYLLEILCSRAKDNLSEIYSQVKDISYEKDLFVAQKNPEVEFKKIGELPYTNILVVEDSDKVRKEILDLISRRFSGVNVYIAVNRHHALSIFNQRMFEVVIADFNLDGEKVKGDVITKELLLLNKDLIVLANSAELKNNRKLMNAGAKEIIGKDMSKLFEWLKVRIVTNK